VNAATLSHTGSDQPPPRGPGLAPGSRVGQYLVLRSLGKGGMGEVYLARDTVLGRRVALKLLANRRLVTAAARTRLLGEARATATFSHPNIVTLFGVGEHHGDMYLVLEYVEGETLDERLRSERPSALDAARVGLAIAEAVAEAHKHKMVHRDLKPANVIIGKDGRVRVLDFGLGKVLGDASQDRDDDPTSAWGTPAYMSPEQWRGREVAEPSDVWAFGVILHELVAGRLPFVAPTVAELRARVLDEPAPLFLDIAAPSMLVELVARCLAKDPRERPTADELCAILGQLTRRRHGSEETCPFPGLSAFTEGQAGVFYGRDAEVESFVERLRDTPLLTVLGPSGAGKSSFVRAGVIPRLKEAGQWTVLVMRPTHAPFDALARMLSPESTGPAVRAASRALAVQLERAPEQLGVALTLRAGHGKLLLFVDQLEEALTMSGDPRTCQRFVEALCLAADDAAGPVRVVCTLRDDFLSRVVLGDRARRAWGQVAVLRTPGREAMAEMLKGPVEDVGYAFEDAALVEEMVDELAGEAASLPLLQFACQTLWDGRDRERRRLTRQCYQGMGGVAGALAEHANRLLAGMTEEQLAIVRELLMRLVTPQGTRRLVAERALCDGLPEEARQLIGRLTGARLVSARRSSHAGEAQLELAHESLIVSWHRLRRWLEEGREELLALEELGQAAKVWATHGERAEHAWTGEPLARAERSTGRSTIEPPPLIRRFLDASRAKERRRTRRKRWSRIGGIGGMALVTTAALIVAGVIKAERDRATSERNAAIQRRAEAEREGARGSFARSDLVAARALLRSSLETEDSAITRALWGRISASPLYAMKSLGASEQWGQSLSPDGRTLAVPSDNGFIYLVSLPAMTVRMVDSAMGPLRRTQFSPDGRRLMVGDSVGRVAFVDMTTERLVRWRDDVRGKAVMSPDGTLVALADGTASIRFLGSEAGELLKRLESAHPVSEVIFAGSGLLLAAGRGSLQVWDLAGEEVVRTIVTPPGVTALAQGGEGLGSHVAVGTRSGEVYLWRLAAPADEPTILRGHTGSIPQLAFSADGELLATASWDQTARIWQTRTGTARAVLTHARLVGGADISRDGKLLATNMSDGTVRVFELANVRAESDDRVPVQTWAQVAFSPDGRWIATAATDSSIRVRAVSDGRLVFTLTGHTNEIGALAFSPDGRWIASSGYDNTLRLWDVARREQVRSQHRPPGRAIAFSPDSRWLAFTHQTGPQGVSLLDIASGNLSVLGGTKPSTWPVFTPDSRALVFANDALRIVGTSSQRERSLASGMLMETLAISPDGRWLGAVDRQGRLLRLSLENGEELAATAPEVATQVLAHPDGRLITRSANDLTIWSQSGVRQRVIETGGGHSPFALSPDGTLIAASQDGVLRLWSTATGRPFWHAPVLLPADVELLSAQEWRSLQRGATASPPVHAWRKAIEAAARHAAASGDVLCVRTFDGKLQLWSMQADERAFERPVADLRGVRAHPRGCLVLAGTELKLYASAGGDERVLASDVQAFTIDGDDVLTAGDARVSVWSPDGVARGGHDVPRGVTAMARIEGWLVVGLRTGQLALVAPAGSPTKPSPSFVSTPSTAVIDVLPGPRGTFIAGFADGFVGVWHLRSGALLESAPLRGAAVHLLYKDQRLYAASELGDTRVLDLSLYEASYCDLMQTVWSRTPLVWEGDAAVARAPPTTHPCAHARGGR
jgi:WD40 repeat protein/tRNA A-37 threonylcarbamoyl transferase component Bud32